MKTEDLQRGDFVIINGIMRKVEQITKKKIGYHIISNESKMHYVRICEVEPVPITPEILKKNGFKDYETDVYYLIDEDAEDTLSISVCLERGRWRTRIRNGYNFQRMHVEYVHELQHALKLCKIDKDIIL